MTRLEQEFAVTPDFRRYGASRLPPAGDNLNATEAADCDGPFVRAPHNELRAAR